MIQFEHCFGLLKRKPWFMFSLNNSKQCSNWIILVSFCSSHLAIKNCYNVHLWKFKNWCKNWFLLKKFKKVCVLQRRACTQIRNFKRNYLENYNDSEHAVKTKNAPFFMIFPNKLFCIGFFRVDWDASN